MESGYGSYIAKIGNRPGRNKNSMWLLKTDFRCEDQAADYDWQVKRKSMAYILFFQAGVIKTIRLYKIF